MDLSGVDPIPQARGTARLSPSARRSAPNYNYGYADSFALLGAALLFAAFLTLLLRKGAASGGAAH
jgi:hypothetical protein